MLVKFGMDTEETLANTTIIFWMHSFISGHKNWIYIPKPGFPRICYSVHKPDNTRRANHIDSWSTASDARQPGRQCLFTVNTQKVRRDVHKCATIHIVYHISNPRYHNSHTIITQITYCTDFILLLQIPKIVRCNVADMCNEKTHHSISIKYELNFATSWWIGKQEIMTQYLYTSMCENCVW